MSIYPNARSGARGGYSPSKNNMIIYGGFGPDGTYPYSDVWVLSNRNGL